MKSKLLLFLIMLSLSFLYNCSEHHNHNHGHSHDDEHSHDSEHTEHESNHNHSGKESHDERQSSHKAGHNHEHDGDSEKHSHHSSGNFGKDKAVKDACEEKGIILSPEAVSAIGLEVSPASTLSKGGSTFRVPKESLVFYENKVCVYYQKDNWYTMTDVKIIKSHRGSALIRTSVIKGRYSIVTKGADLLRLAHLEAFGASGHGHVH